MAPAAVGLSDDHHLTVDPKEAPPLRPQTTSVFTRGIPEKLDLFERLGLLGIRLHSVNWGSGDEDDVNSLTLVVPQLYGEEDEVRG